MTTVRFATNYPMDDARRKWEAGFLPEQHLWGAGHLERAGHDVVYLPWRPWWGRTRIGGAIGSRVGQPVPQWAARARGPAVAYAADPGTFAGLAQMRSMGLWRMPIVTVVHPRLSRSRLRDRGLRSYDVAIALSRIVHEELLSMGRSPERTLLLPWGPDLRFPQYTSLGDELVVSTGKTHRDNVTLLEALRRTGIPARVHVDPDFSPSRVPPNVELVVSAPYAVVLEDLRRAKVIVISLDRQDQLCGITELNDALALAKPVAVTRNPYLDVDVDDVGCGRTVAPHDPEDLASALQDLTEPDRARRAGACGRAFAEAHWNAQHFGQGVVEAVAVAAASA